MVDDDVIIEFRRFGNAVRVSAMDPDSLTEVSIVGPVDAGEAALTQTVLGKLDYVLRRRRAAVKARARP